MRRIVWVAVGAAGGIVAYRRIQQAMLEARERGVVLSVQQVGLSAMQAVNSARVLASGAMAAAEARSAGPSGGSGSAAAHVIEKSQQKGT
jgi:hypothetical protein